MALAAHPVSEIRIPKLNYRNGDLPWIARLERRIIAGVVRPALRIVRDRLDGGGVK